MALYSAKSYGVLSFLNEVQYEEESNSAPTKHSISSWDCCSTQTAGLGLVYFFSSLYWIYVKHNLCLKKPATATKRMVWEVSFARQSGCRPLFLVRCHFLLRPRRTSSFSPWRCFWFGSLWGWPDVHVGAVGWAGRIWKARLVTSERRQKLIVIWYIYIYVYAYICTYIIFFYIHVTYVYTYYFLSWSHGNPYPWTSNYNGMGYRNYMSICIYTYYTHMYIRLILIKVSCMAHMTKACSHWDDLGDADYQYLGIGVDEETWSFCSIVGRCQLSSDKFKM